VTYVSCQTPSQSAGTMLWQHFHMFLMLALRSNCRNSPAVWRFFTSKFGVLAPWLLIISNVFGYLLAYLFSFNLNIVVHLLDGTNRDMTEKQGSNIIRIPSKDFFSGVLLFMFDILTHNPWWYRIYFDYIASWLSPLLKMSPLRSNIKLQLICIP